MNTVDFLKKENAASAGKLAQKVVGKMAKNSPTNVTVVTMITMLANCLRWMGMTEELRQLGIYISLQCGLRGEEVGKLAQLFAPTAPTPSPKVVPVETLVQQQIASAIETPKHAPIPATVKPGTILSPAKPAVAISTAKATAPARTLEQVRDDSFFKMWKGFLTGLVNEKNIPFPNLRSLTVRVFGEVSVQLTADDWKLFANAMKVAEGKKQHIVNNDSRRAFTLMPVELLGDVLFGLEGLVISTTIIIKAGTGELPSWLCAKAGVVYDGVVALDARQRLDEQALKLVINLNRAIENKKGPDWLIDKGESILATPGAPAPNADPDDLARVKAAAQVKNTPMAEALRGFKVNGAPATVPVSPILDGELEPVIM